jgi:hypothetical protein
LGAVEIGLSILASFVLMMRRVKRTALPVHPDMLARVEHLTSVAGSRRVPRVLRSPAVSSAAVCGFWRPVLLLNERFEADLSEDEMDMILRHELAHIRRGDLQINALQCLLLVVHWFNPILWLAFFRARADREAACDEAVVRGESATRRAAYGHALLKMATAFAPSGLCLGFVGILQGRWALRSRIESIIARRRLNAISATAVAIGIAGIALLGISGVGAEPKTDKPANQPPADGTGEETTKQIYLDSVSGIMSGKLDSPQRWRGTSGAASARGAHELSHLGGMLPSGTTHAFPLLPAPGGGGPPLRVPLAVPLRELNLPGSATKTRFFAEF